MKKTIQILSGDMELLDSGTFLTFDNKDITIFIDYKGEQIKLHLRFVNNDDQKNTLNATFEPINDQELRIVFHNYNNIVGQFNTDPIELGTIANQPLFISYYIIHLNETVRKQINYSLYVGKEIQNG